MKNTRFESFLKKMDDKGKYGIKLPLKQKDAKLYIEMLKELLEKKLLSETTYIESVKEIESRSLDEEMYKEFYELLQH